MDDEAIGGAAAVRGYRRRNTISYLAGVGAVFLLLTQLSGSLLRLDEKLWLGVYFGADGSTVRRVVEGSPAQLAGLRSGDRLQDVDGSPLPQPWTRSLRDGVLTVRVVPAADDGAPREASLEPVPYPRSEVLRRILMAGVVLSFVLTGLVVFLSRSDRVGTLFFLMGLLFGRALLPGLPPASRAAFLADKLVLDLAILVLPAVLLHFFLSFPRRAAFLQRNPRLAWLLYVPAIVGMPLSLAFDLEVIFGEQPISPAALRFQSFMAMIFVGMAVWAVAAFLNGVRRLRSPVLRRSVRWVLPGTALGILPPLLLSAVINTFPSVQIPGDRYAFVALVLVPLSFAHGIIRYGLMDLELVAKRSVVYTALTAVLVAVYYVFADALGRAVLAGTGPARSAVSFAVVFAAALLFVPLRDRVQDWVDRRFYRRRQDDRRTLQEFSRLFATFLGREELVRLLVERLPDELGVGRAALFVRSSPDSSLHLAGTLGIGAQEVGLPVFKPSPSLMAWWYEFDGPIPLAPAGRLDRFDRLPPDEARLFEAVDPAVVVFLPRERSIEGMLLLGARAEEEPFRGEDLALLATLGDQAGTALSSSRLHEEALERRRLEEELAVAQRIQASLLPDEVPQPPGIEIAAVTRPCHEVGGDFYDFLDFGAQGLGLAVADVAGKGVPAALILSSLQATLRAAAGGDQPPEPIVQRINDRLCQDVQPGSFASLLYAHLDTDRRVLRYVNAGHPAGLVVRKDGRLERLEEGGILLGVERSAGYSAGERRMEDGDLLLLYSDGATDVLNEADEEYGQERLEQLLPRLAHLTPSAVMESIISSVETFVGGALPDDITLLVAKFRSGPETAASR